MALILIADDDEVVRGLLASQLESLGHTCHLAKDAGTAVALVRRAEYDLIITDIRLPVASGSEFLSTVCSKTESVTPSVILTGYSDVGNAIRAMQAGAYDFIRKPWDVRELKAAVARALERRAGLQLRREYQAELERRGGERGGREGEGGEGGGGGVCEFNDLTPDLGGNGRGEPGARRSDHRVHGDARGEGPADSRPLCASAGSLRETRARTGP